MKTNKQRIQRITGIGLFSAAVVVLQFVSMSLRFTTFSITLTLIPIVVGAAIYGIGAGAWLGLVFGLAVLLTGDAASFMAISFPGTIITVLALHREPFLSSSKRRTALSLLFWRQWCAP